MLRQQRPIRVFRPVRRRLLAGVATAFALVSLSETYGITGSTLPPLWSALTTVQRESTLFLGPLAAAIGAVAGGWAHTMGVGPAPGRGYPAIARAQLLPLAGAICVGQLAGFAPLAAVTLKRATAGGPSAAATLASLATLVCLLCLGYALGLRWASRLAPLIALIVALPIIVAPAVLTAAAAGDLERGTLGRSFLSIGPVWLDFDAGIGQQEVTVTGLLRTVLFAATGLAAVTAALLPMTGTGKLRALTPLAAPLLLGVALVLRQPILVEPLPERSCTPAGDYRVCVPGDVQALLPALAGGSMSVLSRFGTGAASPLLTDGADLSAAVDLWLGADSLPAARSAAALAAARAVSGFNGCASKLFTSTGPAGSAPSNPELQRRISFTSELSTELAARSGSVPKSEIDSSGPPPSRAEAAAFAALTDAKLRGWLDLHSEGLAACTVDGDSFA